MSHLERALEWLRPLILGSNAWDYCVLWKLVDDPSRFIEWVGCCCIGGNGDENKPNGMKKRKKEQDLSIPLCRDAFYLHPANTKACAALARLPSSLPLYSGFHGDVAILSQPRWVNTPKTSDSNSSNEQESSETQVFIPVIGGLVELFAAKLIPEDLRLIEFIKAQFSIYSETEKISTSTMSFKGHFADHFLEKNTNSCLSSLNQPGIPPWPQTMIPVTHHYNHPNLDGSSTGSFPSEEQHSPDSNPCSVSQTIPLKPCSSSHEDSSVPNNTLEARQRPERGRCKSKNLFTERNRRTRIKDGLFALRALVPKITKMDRATILGDAIDYIGELENQIKELQDELKNMAKGACQKNVSDSEQKISRLDEKVGESRDLASFDTKKVPSILTKRPKSEEVQVKVNQLDTGDFLLRIICEQNPGAFTRLLEALASLGIHLYDANVTTCSGTMLSILSVQSNKNEIKEDDLRDSLTRLKAVVLP